MEFSVSFKVQGSLIHETTAALGIAGSGEEH
jgi:hypothetical protein